MCGYTYIMKKFPRDKNGKIIAKPILEPPKSAGHTKGAEVKIAFNVNKCHFLSSYPPQLNKALTAPFPGYVFTPSYKAGHWDGMHRFITRAGYFPTGLLPVVVHILKTGNNPLINPDKKGYIVLTIPAKSIEIIPDKDAEKAYYPGMENFFEYQDDLLKNLSPETGEFTFPMDLLRAWIPVKQTNPLAPQILGLAKALHEAYTSK